MHDYIKDIQNPAIAQVVAALARGSQSPVKDGVLATAVQPYTYDRQGGNFEAVPGPTKMDRVHPKAGPGGAPSGPQAPIMRVAPGGKARTMPGPMEGQAFGPTRLSHTGAEKGGDQEAVVDMLLAMGMPPAAIQQILMEMQGGR